MGICGLEEAKEILENVMADEVIGIYCDEIQKTTECAKNCEKEDCFLQQAIDTVIAELERLQKENEEYECKIILSDEEYRKLIDEAQKDCIRKDNIREKIDNRISTVENLLDEMIDKSIGCINVSYLSKKEKEEVILKRNCLIVQKATLIDIKKDLLKEE